MEKLQKEPVSFEMARMVCYDTVNVTVRTLLSMRDRVNPEISRDLMEHLESMVSFDSVEELTGKLKTLVCGACSAEQDSGVEKTDQRSENLKQYVRDNCFQSDFSLQMAADHFGLTPSNLSHYFKNCTGLGLSEYVQEVRRTAAVVCFSMAAQAAVTDGHGHPGDRQTGGHGQRVLLHPLLQAADRPDTRTVSGKACRHA